MYIVTIHNGQNSIKIHDGKEKLSSGKIVQGINTIDSFTMTLLPSNKGFNKLYDYITTIDVYNTSKRRYEFYGRVLYTSPSMSNSGLITKEAVCESYLGFLCDSQQNYIEEKKWTFGNFFQTIIDQHNSLVEDYKRFEIGEITIIKPDEIITSSIDRKNTWETIKEKLIDVFGGEIRFRVEDGKIYLDYLKEIGKTSTTPIALSRNMKAITQEKDASEVITRLIPLGFKLKAEETTDAGETEFVETEYRLDITSVNDGKNYIDDEKAIGLYGIRVGTVIFDEVQVASTLLSRGLEWLNKNNKISVKYSATALDLSLLGLDIDDFEVYNYHPLKNKLLDIDDTVRIIKKNIDICEEVKSTIELGEKFDSLSDVYVDYSKLLGLIVSDYVPNKKFIDTINKTTTLIKQTESEIRLEVTGMYNDFSDYVEGILELKIGYDDTYQVVSMINAVANQITITSDYFKLTADGHITATGADITGKITATTGEIGDCKIDNGRLIVKELSTNNSDGDIININQSGISLANNDISTKIQSGYINLYNGTNSNTMSGNAIIMTYGNYFSRLRGDLLQFMKIGGGKVDIEINTNGITLGDTTLTEHALKALLSHINYSDDNTGGGDSGSGDNTNTSTTFSLYDTNDTLLGSLTFNNKDTIKVTWGYSAAGNFALFVEDEEFYECVVDEPLGLSILNDGSVTGDLDIPYSNDGTLHILDGNKNWNYYLLYPEEEVTEISFTVDGQPYPMPLESTWYDWYKEDTSRCDFDDQGYVIDPYSNGYYLVDTTHYYKCHNSDLIANNEDYIFDADA